MKQYTRKQKRRPVDSSDEDEANEVDLAWIRVEFIVLGVIYGVEQWWCNFVSIGGATHLVHVEGDSDTVASNIFP